MGAGLEAMTAPEARRVLYRHQRHAGQLMGPGLGAGTPQEGHRHPQTARLGRDHHIVYVQQGGLSYNFV